MTQQRNDPEAISNWFDRVLEGIGHRGSSFTNVDALAVAALTHDGNSRRFLFQEFKRPREECSTGQWYALYDLARQPRTTVWLVRQGDPPETVDLTAFQEVAAGGILRAATLTLDAYRDRYRAWWDQSAPPAPVDDGCAPRLVWSDYVKHDPSLQAFIAGELARERLAVQTLTDDRDHWKHVAARLDRKLHDARASKRASLFR